jgi:hypothetical protein
MDGSVKRWSAATVVGARVLLDVDAAQKHGARNLAFIMNKL